MKTTLPAESLRLSALPAAYFIYRLPPEAALPAALCQAEGVFCARTAGEVSLLLPERLPAPANSRREGPWRGFRVAGALDFSLVGVLAGLSQVLAAAGIPILAVSTYDTDYLWVPADRWRAACRVLLQAGYVFEEDADDGR